MKSFPRPLLPATKKPLVNGQLQPGASTMQQVLAEHLRVAALTYSSLMTRIRNKT